MRLWPSTFRFSLKITLTAIFVAALMLKASHWQWQRYLEKTLLVSSYQENASSPATPFEKAAADPDGLNAYHFRALSLEGVYDYRRQVAILNRRDSSGPGQLLLTPLKLPNTETRVLISRGLIPFRDREPSAWPQYDGPPGEQLKGVLQASVGKATPISPSSRLSASDEEVVRNFLYPDLEAIARQLPYPVLTSHYLQRIKKEGDPEFPAEYVKIKVPPSTHFGYTIEWALLATLTMLGAFFLQAFPDRFTRRRPTIQGPNDLSSSPRVQAEEDWKNSQKSNGFPGKH